VGNSPLNASFELYKVGRFYFGSKDQFNFVIIVGWFFEEISMVIKKIKDINTEENDEKLTVPSESIVDLLAMPVATDIEFEPFKLKKKIFHPDFSEKK
jgi:hypothetical protein